MIHKARKILLGNEAIGLGLVEGEVRVVSAYPGTPSSEILPAVARFSSQWDLGVYTEWSINEKVAFDQAFAAAMSGKRAACCMKQVGLNVAYDSFMSAAYIGVVGGLVVISCDDPGPHSSQTEQDSRLMARVAKVPVFDPSSPMEARRLSREALRLSERFQVPVLLRSVTRLSHARQDMPVRRVRAKEAPKAHFKRDVARWAATPRFRSVLHRELNRKLDRISRYSEQWTHLYFPPEKGASRLGIIASGVPFQMVRETLMEGGIDRVPILKLDMPFPFPRETVSHFLTRCRHILVMEEPDTLIEFYLPSRERVLGRMSGHVPPHGELLPDSVWEILDSAMKACSMRGLSGRRTTKAEAASLKRATQEADLPVRRPTLCPGCAHRASFYAIKRAFPKAIFPSDIGCYSLGVNLGGVDTILDMGSGITVASGLYQAYHQDDQDQPIIATIGDSTFYHSGTAALINAVYNDARFVLVLLDNQITAMTGMQPTPGLGLRSDGSQGRAVPLERVVAGCGVDFVKVHDPYDVRGLTRLLKAAYDYALSPDGGVAVIIARHPCVIGYRHQLQGLGLMLAVNQKCKGCRHCLDAFECPAMVWDPADERARIEPALCVGCGVCVEVCPKGAIQVLDAAGGGS